MPTSRHADLDLRCAACGDPFVYSAGEQELHALRGVAAQPSECPSCQQLRARGRSLARGARSAS